MSNPTATGSSLVQAAQEPLAVTETAGMAMAAGQKALIEAAYVVALRNPRNMEVVRQRLLSECQRPGFAETARYAKPMGREKVTGLSIRFAEAAMRLMGNLDCQQAVTFDDLERRIIKVTVRDLETNSALSTDVTIEKTVERKSPDATRERISERKNTKGETVYLLTATEDEVFTKQNAMLSKARRNLILAYLPGDIADECDAQILTTVRDRDKKDPKAALRRVTDSFYSIGVDAEKLEQVVGHSLDTISPAELHFLRTLFTAVKDGETTMADIDAAMIERDAPGAGKKDASARGVAGLKVRLGVVDSAPDGKASEAPKDGAAPPAAPEAKAPAK